MPNFFKVMMDITFNTTLSSTSTWLIGLLLMKVLTYRGFKCLLMPSKGLVNYIIVGSIIVSLNNVDHFATSGSISPFKLLNWSILT